MYQLDQQKNSKMQPKAITEKGEKELAERYQHELSVFVLLTEDFDKHTYTKILYVNVKYIGRVMHRSNLLWLGSTVDFELRV